VSASPRVGIPRRRVLVGALLAVPAVAGCSLGASGEEPPDPLIALADAARADAALAGAAIRADAALGPQLQPLVEARTAHAAALEAEVVRLDPERTAGPAAPPAPTAAPPPTGDALAGVRAACAAAAAAAAAAALDLPADRVGLVASVSACCATYAAVLR
jgi:hypothetical protein